MSKYKVGDKVKINDSLNGYTEYKGKIFTIKKIGRYRPLWGKEYPYTLVEDNMYTWAEDELVAVVVTNVLGGVMITKEESK